MARTLGIIQFTNSHIRVEGMSEHRPIAAISILGRYRVIDFMMSNLSNSGIDRIQVYAGEKPRSLVEHLGTGRHYNINSKNGGIQVLFPEPVPENYNTNVTAFAQNMDELEEHSNDYVVIAPSYMIFAQDFAELRKTHIESGADVSVLYHSVSNAKEAFLGCNVVSLDSDKKVTGMSKNRGKVKNCSIGMDTYFMKKELFIELIREAQKVSSMYTFSQILDEKCEELNIRGVQHRGYFAAITNLKSFYDANMELLDRKTAQSLFNPDWPIYTRTNNSCPTQYLADADVRGALVSNGCIIDGTVENSIIGRGCVIGKDAVIKNSVISAGCRIGKGVHIEGQVVDKYATITKVKEIISDPSAPGYVKRKDVI